jgi:hypothetical protein
VRAGPPRRSRPRSATLLAVVLAVVYLLAAPPSADLAAQTYRTWLADHAGFVVFDTGWYGGHHVPAYSLLFPPLATLIGMRLLGAVSAVIATVLFTRIVAGRGTAGRIASWWFATGVTAGLVSGRLTFVLGVALATAAVLAIARERWALAAVLGALSGLGSPVAAAFLTLLLVAWSIPAHQTRRAAAVIVASLAPAAALSLAFPEGGTFPFVGSAFWPMLVATLVVLRLLPREAPALRLGTALYALLLVVSAAVPTAMGGNAARLGALLAGPVVALALWPRRRLVVLALLPVVAYWQWQTPINDWVQAARDPSIHAAYYRGLLAELERRPEGPVRLEIPFTDNHWESAHVAPHVALARGWERQLDRKVNALFYDGRPLTAERYHAWLRANAVAYVALPDAPIDPSAAAEAALIRRRPAFLRIVWRDAHWQLYAVSDAVPLADRGAHVTFMGPDEVRLQAARPGAITLRVRWTPYWGLAGGCVARAGDWTRLTVPRAGAFTLRARFALRRVRATTSACA